MKLNKLMNSKIAIAGLIASLSFSSLGAMSTQAADDKSQVKSNDVTITIESGGLHLNIPDIVYFDSQEINENIKQYTTKFADRESGNNKIQIKDLRGTYAGWNLTAQATQFQNESNHKLPAGSLKVSSPISIENLNQKGIGNQIDGPSGKLSTQTAIDDGNAVSLVSAKSNEGAGTYDIDLGQQAFEVSIDPATAKVGTYKSTVTWTLENTLVLE